MNRVRLLIADAEQNAGGKTADFFRQQSDIQVTGVTSDGREAIQMIQETRPQVVLLSLALAYIDGTEVLRRLSEMNLHVRPKILVYSALCSEFHISQCMHLGAACYLMRPMELSLLHRRVLEYANQTSKAPPSPAPNPYWFNPYSAASYSEPAPAFSHLQLTDLLLAMGIPASHSGYAYLRSGVEIMANHPDQTPLITKQLYPVIAQRHNTTPTRVERAIRHSIEVAWERGQIARVNQLAGYELLHTDRRPGNGALISLLAGWYMEQRRPEPLKMPVHRSGTVLSMTGLSI